MGVERDKQAFVEKYQPLLSEPADAILDVVVLEAGYGGVDPLFDREMRPILRVRTRLVSGKTMETLYADEIFYGRQPLHSGTQLKAAKTYLFPNLESVIVNKAKAAEGLRVAADEVARHVVAQFTAPTATVPTDSR